MMDRETVIRALECCTDMDKSHCNKTCPYWGEYTCRMMMELDALALLKAQEPKEVAE